MTVDETINAWLAPIADWLGKVVFFSVPVGRRAAAADRRVAHHGRHRLHARVPVHEPARLPALGARHPRRLFEPRASRRSLAVPGAEHRGVRHRGPGQHRRRRGGGDAGRARRHVVDDARRLPRHEPQVRRSHAGREIPARARGRHGDRRRDVLRARGAAAASACRASANSSRDSSAWPPSAVRSPSSRSARPIRRCAPSPASTRPSCSGSWSPIWIGIVLFGGVKRIVQVDRQALAVHVPAVHRRLPRRARRELRQHPAGARHHRARSLRAGRGGRRRRRRADPGLPPRRVRERSGHRLRAHGARHGAHQRAHVAGLRGADGALPRHHHHLPAHRAGHRGQRRATRPARASASRSPPMRSPPSCRGSRSCSPWWPCCSRCPPCSPGATTASRRGCGCSRRAKAQPRGVPAVPVRACCRSPPRFRSTRWSTSSIRCSFCMADPEHHRHLSTDAGAARRSRQLLAARGAQERAENQNVA